MSMRFTGRARRGMFALTLAVGLALGTVGCSGDDDKKPDTSASASRDRGSAPSAQEGKSTAPLAELKGRDGLLLQITSAQRDGGGFLTVNAQFKNDGSGSLTIPAELRGDETEILKHGTSLGGATLVDSGGKKRYYVLRDTDGRPLTTTGLTTIESGQTIPVFMQFPTPPSSTTDVTLQIPTFASAPIKISG
ncbi:MULTISPECIES: hypothetical protein [Streptomyces]|uniref:Secreted protein n=1 Tax=Streptomyces koelreuteriae TaxID=2838015 RepID=A0ABX8FQC3_9ACTN|nr:MULTISPECIES: hypothetical protein [Streptomyces]QWB23336.1 hypothetical protein KJK29_12375 [Streptomyces koelreuteriae]UUA11299.1 hypothetical protein NNW98_12430 [Streptomyces koelreuteriae]UUA13915.1 hypothetical protein NNW99_12430 [Streptomyces sp. CRCS-T-1]